MPDLMPDSPLSAKRRRAGLVTAVTIGCVIEFRSVYASFPSAGSLVTMAVAVIINTGCVVYGWRAIDQSLVRPPRPVRPVRPGQGGRKGIARAHGRDDGAGLAPPATGWWPVLRGVSRLMPRAAGRRWLAEAESLLFEVPAGLRRTVVRSYLRSAPRLALMMWAAELSRRARRHIR